MKFYDYKRKEVDLINHSLNQRAMFGNKLKIHIGTDSVAVGGNIVYFTVVAYRHSKNGVHFIFMKERVNKFRDGNQKPDIFTRLWRECKLTMDVATELTKIFKKDDIIIELDYNNLVETVSTKLVASTRGWAIGEGFKCLVKYKENATRPDQWEDQLAVKAANHLCQGISS